MIPQSFKDILFVMSYSILIILYLDIYNKDRVGQFIINHTIGFVLALFIVGYSSPIYLKKIELKKVNKRKNKIMSSVLEDTLFSPQTFILAIFGYNNKISESDLQEKVLLPLLEETEKIPNIILLPSEGNSSIYISKNFIKVS